MIDLTKGKPIKVILLFTLPLLLGNIFQLLYNLIDAIIVGQTLGKEAFAAVGATSALNFLIMGFAIGITSGFAIIISQRFGADDEEGVKNSFVIGLFLTLATSIILSLIAFTFARPLLEIMQTPKELLADAHQFLKAIFGGMIFTVLFNYLSNVMRAIGDSRTPLIALIISTVLNVGLEFLFILGLHAGVFGAGIATVIAQTFSVVFLVVYIKFKVPVLHFGKKNLKLDKKEMKRHSALGYPMGFQSSIIAIGSLTMQIVLNKLGSDVVAMQAIGRQIDQIAMQPMISLGLAVTTFAAQNYGAKKYKRMLIGLKHAVIVDVIWGITFCCLLLTCNKFFSGLFVSPKETHIMALAFDYYLINGVLYWVLAILFIVRGFIQGCGNSLVPTLAGIAELVMRAGVSVLGLMTFGLTAVIFASPAAWIGSVMILIPSYLKITKDLKNKEKAS
ncbi:MATE family efflux transporter [Lactococcus hodotermopsidis]|uniref:Probable multidrug resistance protein NorM n=1 Tax=Pseudolactococcus hodotermopsidis TaxID=2709157 RepID=A0A6A0BCB5_9LACT|nr:MATE family efflux transporter [Lactococcus hodotermopsidis]GFH42305.1 MATE family efflux transporter [Lactococcus hodotermopsidis]